MSGRGLDPETVEQDPSQVKASKRLKQVEEKRRIEAQCDGHLLENEKVNPRNVTQRPKNMSKDDAKRVAWDAAWKSPTERKGRFFSSKKINGQNVWLESPNRDQIQKLVAWCQFSFFRSGRINCLLGEQQWPSTTCFLARCSLRRCGHERRFARSSVRCVFHSFLQACCQQEINNLFFSPELCAKRSQMRQLLQNHCNKFMGKFWFDISTHGVISRIREENFAKKGRAVKTDKEFLDMFKSSHL